jgi:predicted nucleotidyltransferase
METDHETPPEELAGAIVAALATELRPSLLGVVGHGSWVHGDFAPGRSDLDLLIVLQQDPSPELVRRIEPILTEIVEADPPWRDRLELGFVTPKAVDDVLRHATTPHQSARISPGEPLHLIPAARHQLLDWEAATRGVALYGPPPTELLPSIPAAAVRAVVREHLHNWPTWVEAGDPAAYGFQAYAVLTVCRAAALLGTGERLSKRQAARWATTVYPQWGRWIDWAEAWWYDDGSQDDRPPRDGRDVKQFVAHVADRSEGAID